jgi:hypothetical protein
MEKDGDSWRRMETLYEGSSRFSTEHGERWRKMEKHREAWRRMEKDGERWRKTEKDGEEWRRLTHSLSTKALVGLLQSIAKHSRAKKLFVYDVSSRAAA